MLPKEWDQQTRSAFQERLLSWYHKHKRAMPWRENPTPYRVWISELMLQQTRVDQVIPYFERFMTAFPDVRTLARASLDQVLKCWEGMGYYARARNMRRAAQQIVEAFGGRIP
ncbi:MAG: A/G-specific adenine glycosylase, partial [Candidatus Latescibacteria bacterium]|nr:A/G-specific adenine glycosylase [Candidatus Latescibacterota bacterium]